MVEHSPLILASEETASSDLKVSAKAVIAKRLFTVSVPLCLGFCAKVPKPLSYTQLAVSVTRFASVLFVCSSTVRVWIKVTQQGTKALVHKGTPTHRDGFGRVSPWALLKVSYSDILENEFEVRLFSGGDKDQGFVTAYLVSIKAWVVI